MKLFAFAFIAFVATASAAPRDTGDLADAIANLLAELKKLIPEDADLKLTDKTWEIPENSIENGKIVVNELSLSGLKSLEYDVAEDSAQTNLKYDLNIAELIAVIDLNLDLTGLLTADDRILIKVDLLALDLAGDFTFTDTDYTELNEFDALISLKSSPITIEGVISDEYSKELTETLTKRVPELVNQIALAVEEPVSEIIRFVVNLVLKVLS